MEWIFNLFIFVIIALSVLARVKKNRGGPGQQQEDPSAPPKFTGLLEGLIVPKNNGGEVNVSLAALGLANKQLDKIVTVYGAGAMLGIDEVSILLNVSEGAALDCLEQLAGSNRAVKTMSTGGKMRYKLL